MTVNGSASTSVVIDGCTERNGFDSCSNMVIHCPSTSRKLQNGSCSIEGVDGMSTVPTVHAVTVHTEDAFHDLTIGGVVVEDSYIHCGNDNVQFSCKLNENGSRCANHSECDYYPFSVDTGSTSGTSHSVTPSPTKRPTERPTDHPTDSEGRVVEVGPEGEAQEMAITTTAATAGVSGHEFMSWEVIMALFVVLCCAFGMCILWFSRKNWKFKKMQKELASPLLVDGRFDEESVDSPEAMEYGGYDPVELDRYSGGRVQSAQSLQSMTSGRPGHGDSMRDHALPPMPQAQMELAMSTEGADLMSDRRSTNHTVSGGAVKVPFVDDDVLSEHGQMSIDTKGNPEDDELVGVDPQTDGFVDGIGRDDVVDEIVNPEDDDLAGPDTVGFIVKYIDEVRGGDEAEIDDLSLVETCRDEIDRQTTNGTAGTFVEHVHADYTVCC